MKQGKTMQDLAKELDRQHKTKRDFIAPMHRVAVSAIPGTQDIGMRAGKETFPLNRLAEDQLARRVEIPVKYFNRMKTEAPGLLEDNVNHWLKEGKEDKMMIRTLDNRVRAILSDKYRPLDNMDLAGAVLPTLAEMKINVMSAEVTDNRLYIKAITEKISAELHKGDVVQAGIVISNSEVGLGAVKIEPMVYRLVCTNGMISADSSMRKYHVGRGDSSDDNMREYFANETRIQDDKAFWMKCRDIVKGALNEAIFKKLVDRMKETAGNMITGKPEDVIEVVRDQFVLSDPESQSVLNHLMAGKDLSQFALVNAVTRASQDVADYDRATDLERMGGDILELRGRSWDRIATATA